MELDWYLANKNKRDAEKSLGGIWKSLERAGDRFNSQTRCERSQTFLASQDGRKTDTPALFTSSHIAGSL